MQNSIVIKARDEKEASEILKHAFNILNCYWPNESRRIEDDDLSHRIFKIQEDGCICFIDSEIENKYSSDNVIPIEIFLKIKKIDGDLWIEW